LKEKSYPVDYVVDYMNNIANYFSVSFSKDSVFALIDDEVDQLNKKIDAKHPILQDICLVGKGMETAADDIFLFDKKPSKIPARFFKRRVTGKNIERYFIRPESNFILYFEDIVDFKDLPISIQNHLNENKKILSNRADKKRRETSPWWNYTFAMHKEYYHLPKLFCSRRAFCNTFCYDDGFNYLGFSNMTVIFETNAAYSLKYILALLNSKLLTFRYRSIGKQTGGGSFEYFPNGVGKLPIPVTDIKTQYEFIVLVDKMFELKQREYAEQNPQTKKIISRQIDGVDNMIDQSVYKLYNLNTKDIEIVEQI